MLTSPYILVHHLQQGSKTCTWLTMMSSIANGTYLGAQGWRNTLFLHCNIDPQNSLPAVMCAAPPCPYPYSTPYTIK